MQPKKYFSDWKRLQLNDLREKTPYIFPLGTRFALKSYQT